MRYPDGGGLTARQRAARERVRRQAAGMFEQDADPVWIARELRVSAKSVYAWRRAWRATGVAGLVSQGPGGFRCRLGPEQMARLAAELDNGPAVHGWADQRWTLERVAVLIGRLFKVAYTPRGVSYLLHRMGYTPQAPVHRAAERDEGKIAAWRAVTWAKVRG
jgi:transposase